MGTFIFYIASVVASLYATYLLAYNLYDVPYDEDKEPKRILLPRIAYIVCLIIAFVPILNDIGVALFLILCLIGKSCHDFQVKCWFFDTPKLEDEKKQ